MKSKITVVSDVELLLEREDDISRVMFKDNTLMFTDVYVDYKGQEIQLGIDYNLEEMNALILFLNQIKFRLENRTYIAYGENLFSDIEFHAKSINEAIQWVRENVGWDADVMLASEYYKQGK